MNTASIVALNLAEDALIKIDIQAGIESFQKSHVHFSLIIKDGTYFRLNRWLSSIFHGYGQ